ncbi:MAG: hypothetical protein JXB08_05430 [Bacilli bacterium]|nr:hypothetical protein [Bacilli bacterium]MBN2876876.1 hypothetical protein [Bacilli bacterium]
MRWFLGIVVLFLALDPVTKIPSDASVSIYGTYEQESISIEYGSIQYRDGDYGGYFRISDRESGALVDEQIVNTEWIDIIWYVADVGNGEFLFICKQYTQSDLGLPVFLRYIIYHYDLQGKVLEFLHSTTTSYRSFHNHNHILVFLNHDGSIEYMNHLGEISPDFQPEIEFSNRALIQYQGQAYVNQELVEAIILEGPGYYDISIVDDTYHYNYRVSINPSIVINGERFEDYYIQDVTIDSQGILYLNNQLYESGSIVSTPGNYLFQVFGENGYQMERNFTILPSVECFDGVNTVAFIEGMEFESPLYIYSNAVSMAVDGEYYRSEAIEDVGYHDLILYGVGNFHVEIGFTIYPSVFGLNESDSYENLELTIFGTAYLNGELTSGTVSLTQPGEYRLELLFEGNIYRSYDIAILDAVDSIDDQESSYSYWSIPFLVLAVIGAYYILRKK